jgi:hypothetical protein
MHSKNFGQTMPTTSELGNKTVTMSMIPISEGLYANDTTT